MVAMSKLPAKEQHARFIETARALGCDEDKERFEAALGKIATHKPRAEDKPGRKVKPKNPKPKADKKLKKD